MASGERRRATRRPVLKRTSVFLTEAQIDRLATAHAATGVPVAVMIRRAVDAYLHTHHGRRARR